MNGHSFLRTIELAGNRLPNPTFLFVILCAFVLVGSALAALGGVHALHPITGDTVSAVNLLSAKGVHLILGNTVKNFVTFAPVGTVLVAVLGIAVAEHSGLLGCLLSACVKNAKGYTLSFLVVLSGVLSSLATDTGYVVLIPLAALAFKQANRNPIVGIAAAFAGVSGGYSANLIFGPLDFLLAGISTEAAQLVNPDYEVNAAGNYFFIIASTFLIAALGTWVTERIVAKQLPNPKHNQPAQTTEPPALTGAQKRGLWAVGWFTLGFAALLLAGLIPEQGILRDPETHSVLKSPFIQGIVTIIALYASLCGVIYGRLSGKYHKVSDCIEGMEQHMALMASYLVLMFFAAQFVNYFAWSQLGSIIAISGAAGLKALALPPVLLLIGFILLAAFINLFIGSASAKWALIAPIFVPMLLLTGISPEATQMAYRIGDSSTNIITPLMPYFGVVVAYAQRYDRCSRIARRLKHQGVRRW